MRPASSITWNDWCRARDPEIWGPDAAEFKPSRFLDEKGHLVKPDEWKYHVFNGGRRLCLGMNLALFEGSAVLAALAREFDFEFGKDYLATVPMCENDNTPLYRSSLTLPMVSGPRTLLPKPPTNIVREMSGRAVYGSRPEAERRLKLERRQFFSLDSRL